MNDVILQAMASMGWDPKSALPMANAENLELLKEIEQLTEEKVHVHEATQDTVKRLDKLQKHVKGSKAIIQHNLTLLEAYQAEVRRELNTFKVVQREHSKMIEDLKNLNNDLKSQDKHILYTENELAKRKSKIDEITCRIKWAKSVLLEWQEAMEDGNRGTRLIEKYFKDDEMRAREQNQRRQQLTNEVEKARKQLTWLYDEQKTLESVLECTANLYRAAHAERRQLVETWKAAVQQMNQRENNIHSGERELIQLKEIAEAKDNKLKRFNEKLNSIIQNNHEVEAEISDLNKDSSEIKQQIQQVVDMVLLKEAEVEIVQKQLQNLIAAVEHQRIENRENEKTRNHRLNELTQYEEVLKNLQTRADNLKNKNLSSSDRLQMLESMIENYTKAQNQIINETNRINGLLYSSQQQRDVLKNESKILHIENNGLIVTIQAVKKSTREVAKEIKRQTVVHYELAFKCLKNEREIVRLEGGITDPEEEKRNLEILAELEEQYSHLIKRLQTTEAQNIKMDDNMRKLTNCYNNDNKELEVMYFKIKEAQVYCEGGIKRIKQETHTNQVLIVELSILKMRANEFETEIKNCHQSTYNLSKHRSQLNRTIKDRMIELKSQKDLLNLKQKHLNEEKSTLRADIGDRSKYIEAMRTRFELTSQLLGRNEDGTLVTATQLKVEAAQEKQLLLAEGNELNEKVVHAEKEVEAMENTLMLVNTCNHAFKNTLTPAENIQETEQLSTAKNDYCTGLTYLKRLRSKIHHLNMDNDKAREEKAKLELKYNDQMQKSMNRAEVFHKLQRDIDEQAQKLQRAERNVKKAIKHVKERGFDDEFLALFERDLDLRELQHRNTKALDQIADMADSEANTGYRVMQLLTQKGIELPYMVKMSRSFVSWQSDLLSDGSVHSGRISSRTKLSRSASGNLKKSTSVTSARSQLSASSAYSIHSVTIEFDNNNQ